MPLRSEWRLAREGFTLDTVIHAVARTLLNPWQTVPVLLYALYSAKGREMALKRPRSFAVLQQLVALGLLKRISNFLDKGVINNWTSDIYDWKKEVVVVTGGSDGIGKRVVQMFAEIGVTVVVLDVQPLTFEPPPSVHYFHCDLANPKSIASVSEEIRLRLGNPTVLINNAGFARNKLLLENSNADISLTLDVNVKCHYLLAREFLPAMIKQDHGMVVTVASMAAYVTPPNGVVYAASKAAALAFHEGLRAELATHYRAPRVRTVAVCQNYTRTKLFEGWDKGDGFVGYPLEVDTVAESIVKAVMRGRSDHIVLPTSGWMAAGIRTWPAWMAELLRRDTAKLTKKWKGRQVDQPSEISFQGSTKELTGVTDSDELM